MSATISWIPINPNQVKSLPTGSASQFQETCEKIFGKLPKVFSPEDIPRLEVLAALEDTKTYCPWSDLISIIRDNEKVKVFVEY